MIENLEGEIWKDCLGWEGKYQVSNLGRVKGLERPFNEIKSNRIVTEKLLKQALKRGYWNIVLGSPSKNNSKTCPLHRLVAQAFIPNPENKNTVNHKNGIKTDNRVENLEWATFKENTAHAIRIGLMKHDFCQGEKSKRSKLNTDEVKEIFNLYKKGGKSQEEIGKIYNVNQVTVFNIVNGKRWKHLNLVNNEK